MLISQRVNPPKFHVDDLPGISEVHFTDGPGPTVARGGISHLP